MGDANGAASPGDCLAAWLLAGPEAEERSARRLMYGCRFCSVL
jgi:hypothetical protein